jgi:aspartate kinase
MSALHVLKFGGTSMGTLDAMRQSAAVVKSSPNGRLAVVSAMSGATNQLLKAYRQALDKGSWSDTLGSLAHRHAEAATELGFDATEKAPLHTLEREAGEILGSLEAEDLAALDRLLATGELLCSHLFAKVLRNAGVKAVVVDARLCLRTNDHFGRAEPQLETTGQLSRDKLLPLLLEGTTVVTQGFIGATANGRTTTLGRGGSDYSAALFAEALHADACEIWTDVNGVLTMDPRIVPEARLLPEITFAEAAELANFGAKVLHPATVLPALRGNIKVFVGNTFAPEKGGTWIHPELPEKPTFRAVALRENQTLITVSSARMLQAHGFLAKLFTILADHSISVDLVTTSEVTVTLTIDGKAQGSSGTSVLENASLLSALRSIGEVSIEENLSLVALIGNRLTQNTGIAARAFRALQECNVRLIGHGASAGNICLLVSGDDARIAATLLHREFL